ncbi:MAG: hypothetical protein ACXWLX_14055, partial [Rhizomicrobium sp.]
MLSPKNKTESLAGKLLLSSALVAVSLAYGWWQTPIAHGPAIATAPMPLPPAPNKIVPVPHSAVTAPPVTEEAGAKDVPSQAVAAPPKSSAAPQTIAPSALQAAPEPRQNTESPSPPSAPATQQAAESVSPPPPVAAVEPAASVPAGPHLADGDFVSDRHGLMWGDVRVKVSIHGGQITAVETLEFPDHRAQSAYLSQLALPILESEVIKSQKAQVDVVSSATD